MDCIKIGKLIKALRTKNNFTQKELANKLFISAKTISKWECGHGIPDISLLSALSDVLGVNVQVILHGQQNPNEKDLKNMKNLEFYVCPECNNIISASPGAQISCCNQKLNALTAVKATAAHILSTETIDGELYITSAHPMEKQHFISFAAFISQGELTMFSQYPEWNFSLRLPLRRHGKLYYYCTQHGLFYTIV